MTITTAVVRQAARATVGTQDFTSSGFGTAKACIVIISYGVTDGVAAAHNGLGIGFATGTLSRFCIGPADEDGVATQDCSRVIRNDNVIWLPTPGSSASVAEADFNAFITDGIQLDWGKVSGNAELVTVILLGGTDLSVHANSITWGDTVNEAIDVTAPTFEPDIVFMIGFRDQIFNDPGGGDTESSYGICHNDGASGITQRANGSRYDNGVADAAVELEFYETATLTYSNNGSHDWRVELGTFDANGFTATARDSGGNNSVCAYLALKFANHDSWVGTHDTPTATGDKDETGPNFKPQFGMMGSTLAEAAGTTYVDDHAISTAFSAFDGTNEFCTVVSSEDAATTMNTQSVSDNTAVQLPDNTGSALITASFSSFLSNGFRLNYSAVDTGAARKGWAFAVEEDAAGAAPLPVVAHNYRQRRVAN